MQTLNDDIEAKYVPDKALIIYKSVKGSDYYIENHSMYGEGKTFKLGEGKPLKSDTIRKVFETISINKSRKRIFFKGVIPKTLINFNFTSSRFNLTWLVPEKTQNLFFVDSLEIPSGRAHVPNLIFSVYNSSLSVFAVKTKKINLLTELFKAPFHNINNSGGVCTGNVVTPEINGSIEDLMEEWEKIFFASEFSSLHDNNICSENINLLWKRHINSNFKFPVEALVKSPVKNISQLLKKI